MFSSRTRIFVVDKTQMQRDGIPFNLKKKKKANYFEAAENVTAPCDVSQLRSFLAELIHSGGFSLNLSVWVSSNLNFYWGGRGKSQ